jgi:hypothetical protein
MPNIIENELLQQKLLQHIKVNKLFIGVFLSKPSAI